MSWQQRFFGGLESKLWIVKKKEKSQYHQSLPALWPQLFPFCGQAIAFPLLELEWGGETPGVGFPPLSTCLPRPPDKSATVLLKVSKVTQSCFIFQKWHSFTTQPRLYPTHNEPYRCSPNLLDSHLVWSRFAGEFYQVEFLSNWSCSYNFQWDIIYKIQIKISTGNHFPWSMAEDQVKAFGTKIASQFSSKETNNNNNNNTIS